MTRILIADDEADGRKMLRKRLESEGFVVVDASDGEKAYQLASESPPDLVLSDVAMPGVGGVDLCRRLKTHRRTRGVPVILLSGVHRDEETQAGSLEDGADDYILKPYSPRVLVAKVRALLRRYAAPRELAEVLRAEGLALDPQARTVTIKNRRVVLTRKEFDLLALFLRKRGRVLSVPYLLEAVWDYDPADYNDPHTVQSHMSTLRSKIGPLGRKIANVRGLGYRFDS